ncbi:MAG: hypothetical protein LBB73_05200, partial [Dysgonamonadaceae bacterium]|nr:hypothetical protein [Dysgonamonadaceae bacterium]
KRDWLSTFLRLPGGISSHDTFNRVFSAPDPEGLEKGFPDRTGWVSRVLSEGEVAAIDGRSMCGTGKSGNKSIVHMVSAWVHENRIAPGAGEGGGEER